MTTASEKAIKGTGLLIGVPSEFSITGLVNVPVGRSTAHDEAVIANVAAQVAAIVTSMRRNRMTTSSLM